MSAGLVRRSPLHHVHHSWNARFRLVSDWEMPASYGPVEQEQAALLSKGGICDVSHAGKLVVQGNELLPGLRSLLEVESLEPGSVHVMSDVGGESKVRVAVLTGDEAIILAPHEETESVRERAEEALKGCAHVTDVTSSRAGVLVMGPRSHTVLSKIVEFDVDPLVFSLGTCAQGRAAGTHVLVVRADAAGVLGYELYVTRDHAEHLWGALLTAGKSEGVGPVGLDAVVAVEEAG